MITEFFTRLRFLVFRKKQWEFDKELRFHLEQVSCSQDGGGFER